MALANVTLTDTFDIWRTRTNQIIGVYDETNILARASYNATNAYVTTTANITANLILANTLVMSTIYNNSNTTIGANAANIITANAIIVNTIYNNSNTITNAYLATNPISFAYDKANAANIIASGGFDKANAANIIAVSAFARANTLNVVANLAYDKANSANIFALAANLTGNAAFDKANSANIVAVSAFAKANASLPNTSDVSFAGNLNFPNGNLALGATSTSGLGRLYISGNFTVGDYGFINRHAGGSANTTRGFRQVIDGTEYLAMYHNNIATVFEVNGAERMRIDSTGNVGIGTTASDVRLSVEGGSGVQIRSKDATVTQFVAYPAGDIAYTGNFSNHPLAFLTNNSERMRITASGNVSIGKQSSTATLDVAGSINAASILVNGTALAAGVANVQTFDASGTWTKPTGYTASSRVHIQAWGAGGSGAKASNTIGDRGGGGGGGGFIERWMFLSDLSSTETVTIGAGGAARTVNNTAGATGGNSSVGTKVVSYGGGGGSNGYGGNGGGFTGLASPKILSDTTTVHVIECCLHGASTTNYWQAINADSINYGGAGNAGGGAGYKSVYGGGGGGSGINSGSAGGAGVSTFAGSGGAGGSGTTAATAGAAPGGGGGGAWTGNSGAGASGRIIITVFPT